MSNENERDETLTINGVPYVGLSTYADAHDMDVKHLRRFVRKNTDTVPVRKWGTMWLVERDANVELPDAKSRGKSRSDGRQRFVVYIAPCTDGTHDELQQITDIVGVANVVDPRERARERRANA